MKYKAPRYPRKNLVEFISAPFAERTDENAEYDIHDEPTPYENFISWGAKGYPEYWHKARAYEAFRINQGIFTNKNRIWGWHFINALYFQIIRELKQDPVKFARFKKEIGLVTYFVISLTVPICLYVQTCTDLNKFEL